MEELHPTVKGVRITTQENGFYYLGIIVENDMYASLLYNCFSGNIKLEYEYVYPDLFFVLKVVLLDTKQFFYAHLSLNDETKDIMEFIDRGIITHLFACYPNAQGQIVLYGREYQLSV